MTRRGRLVALLVGALLLAGCGLPLEEGVRTPGSLGVDGRIKDRTAKLPPGPRPGLTPALVVSGFLSAQSSAEDDHAIARQYLAPEIREMWDDDAGVKVYDPQRRVVETVGGADGPEATVHLEGVVTATIAPDGSRAQVDDPLDETYRVRRQPDGEWRLIDVPPGLRLSPGDVARSYTPQVVYYLARGAGAQRHLVPDPALLPTADDAASGLVRRLLQGPSETLAGAVDTAVPPEAAVLGVTTDTSGVVTVDLGPPVAAMPALELEWLSAQLIWTLREAGVQFSGLRLLAGGRAVDVPGIGTEPQDRDAWEDYDPDGLPERVTTYYLADRRLLTLEGERPPGAGGTDLPVDQAAVSPRTEQVALLTDIGEGRWEVRTGPLTRPPSATAAHVGGGLRSPSWGSGRRGLWLLQTGPEQQVQLLDGFGEVQQVPLAEPPPGRLTALRVSRDGARIALVAGEDDASRRVYVATVIQDSAGLRIGRPRPVGPGVTNVSDVAWESGTSLVALGEYAGLAPLPLRMAVDGSGEVALVRLPGLEQLTPQRIAAAPERPLVVSATRAGRPILLRAAAGVFAEEPVSGTEPFYPG